MSDIRPIETIYNGYRFRSRLEARWAVFFDVMGIKYVYEPEGFTMKYGMRYLPDFALLNVRRRHYLNEDESPIYIEVKGVDKYNDIRIDDRVRIEEFAKHYPLLILGNIPQSSWDAICEHGDELFSYEFLDGDHYQCFFSRHNGEPWIAGPDHDEYDTEAADRALAIARQARFEHGETPRLQEENNDFENQIKQRQRKDIHELRAAAEGGVCDRSEGCEGGAEQERPWDSYPCPF